MGGKTNAQLQVEIDELKGKIVISQEEKKAADERATRAIQDMEESEYNIVDNAVVGTRIKVFKPDEYREYSAKEGKIMGRSPNQKTKCSIEELRALINSKWTPRQIMEKHGLNAEDFKQLIWKLSKKELRGKPIKYSIEQNYISREG